MAFKDITKVLYEGRIKVDYKDKAHRYYARRRIDFNLPEDDPKAWSKVIFPKGVTTLMGDTLEKSGLMNYSMTKALAYLFAFYSFTDDNGEKKLGYSAKFPGVLWDENDKLKPLTKEEALEIIDFGAKASTRHKNQGAKIGAVVHDAIEHYVLANDNIPRPYADDDGEQVRNPDDTPALKIQNLGDTSFDIEEQYMANLREADYDSEAEREAALKDFSEDVEKAKLAFNRFKIWWQTVLPQVNGAEDLLYSEEENIGGTYDGDLNIAIQHHPVYGQPFNPEYGIDPDLWEEMSKKPFIRATTDWKTSNATASKSAAAPEGVYYTYFLQDALYEKCRREMGYEPTDDLFVVSARKDGEFTPLFASELGLTVEDCIEWADCVIYCFRMMENIKDALWKHGLKTGAVVEKPKKVRGKK
jgi:hypothetical protein